MAKAIPMEEMKYSVVFTFEIEADCLLAAEIAAFEISDRISEYQIEVQVENK